MDGLLNIGAEIEMSEKIKKCARVLSSVSQAGQAGQGTAAK